MESREPILERKGALVNRARPGSDRDFENTNGRLANRSEGTSAAAAAVFDRRAALRRLEGDEELFADLASFYVRDMPELVVALDAALVAGRPETAQRAAHSLKGLASSFDAAAAACAAARVEHLLGRRPVPDLTAEVAELKRELDRLAQALAGDAEPVPPADPV